MACLIIGLDSDSRAYVLEEYYRKRMDVEDLGNWIQEKKKKYSQLVNIYADPSEPMFINKLNQMGLNVLQARNEVMPGINFVYSMFEIQKDGKPRIFISLNCGNLIDEINSYRYAEPKEEKDAKEEPLKIDNHLVDSLRYALYTHLEGRGNYFLLSDDKGVIF